MHVVLRSSFAKGRYSLLYKPHSQYIRRLLVRKGSQHGVRIEHQANSGNHLHLLVKATTRQGFQNFLRDISGKIAQRVTGARKGKPFGKRFWDVLAFSRIVQPGRDWKNVVTYVFQNTLEATKTIAHQPRGTAHQAVPDALAVDRSSLLKHTEKGR